MDIQTYNGLVDFGFAGELILLAHYTETLSDRELIGFVDASTAASAARDTPIRGTITLAGRYRPTPRQRQLISEHPHRQPMERLCVMSDSGIVRGMVTALNWLSRDGAMKAFAIKDIDRCLRWMGEVLDFEAEDARKIYDELLLRTQGADESMARTGSDPEG